MITFNKPLNIIYCVVHFHKIRQEIIYIESHKIYLHIQSKIHENQYDSLCL